MIKDKVAKKFAPDERNVYISLLLELKFLENVFLYYLPVIAKIKGSSLTDHKLGKMRSIKEIWFCGR